MKDYKIGMFHDDGSPLVKLGAVVLILALLVIVGAMIDKRARNAQQADDARTAIKLGIARYEADPETGEPVVVWIAPGTCKPLGKFNKEQP